jgi:hypothetical protein
VTFRVSFALIGICAVLAGCAAPMRQGEAQMIAAAGLRRFCRDQPCGPTKLVSAQKIKDRWLVDFDAPAGKYAVAVDSDGSTQVSIWDKNSPAR